MKLLLHSRFFPSVGGIETVAELLAREWNKQNLTVTVVSDVAASNSANDFPFAVRHRPSPESFLALMREHDVFIHFNVSLRASWPLLFVRRRFIAVHHGFYVVDQAGHRDWREHLKLRVAKRANQNIAVSSAIAKEIGVPCTIIPNPYDDVIFNNSTVSPRDRDLIFVGRLVSEKGVDVLIQSLRILRARSFHPRLTIVGDGPQRNPLQRLAIELEIEKQIEFCGAKHATEIAELLREHKVLIVPSLWKEPFGVVALEGIACGCAVIGSDGGGLPEAIGPCGLVFRRGDASDLADKIEMLLRDVDMREKLRSSAAEHLAKHRPSVIAARYLEVIEQAISGNV